VPTYVVLGRFRDRALETIGEMPARSAAGRLAAESLGCKVLGAEMGEILMSLSGAE
jgi:uncharacterized protein with GYD domain